MALDPPLDVPAEWQTSDAGRLLVDDMARRAVQAWLAKQSSKKLEREMLLRHDYGTSPAEAMLDILREWADA